MLISTCGQPGGYYLASAGVIFHISLARHCAWRYAQYIITELSIIGCSINMMDMTFEIIKLAQNCVVHILWVSWDRKIGIRDHQLGQALQVIAGII